MVDAKWSLVLNFFLDRSYNVPFREKEVQNFLEAGYSVDLNLISTYRFYESLVLPVIGYLNRYFPGRKKYRVPAILLLEKLYLDGRLDLLFIFMHALLETHRPIYIHSFDTKYKSPYISRFINIIKPCLHNQIDVVQGATIVAYLQARVIIFDWQHVNPEVTWCINRFCNIDLSDYYSKPVKDTAMLLMPCSIHAAIMFIAHAYYGAFRKYVEYNYKRAKYPKKMK